MSLSKRTYVDNETLITAQNLNDIQDEIIANASSISSKSSVSGTDDGTNWTSLTIDGTTKAIPAGGGGGGSDKMDKANPTGTGSFSLNRATGSTVGTKSFAEGNNTTASGESSHAEGQYTTALGIGAHSEGYSAAAEDPSSVSITPVTVADNYLIMSNASHGITVDSILKHTDASGNIYYYGVIGVDDTEYSITLSEYIDDPTTSNWWKWDGIACGDYSHSEGNSTKATASSAHAEGYKTVASGNYGSHAEGGLTLASGGYSHAEGDETVASGARSHAEGEETVASGRASHSEGNATIAGGEASHAEGLGTKASSDYQHVFGKYNIEDADSAYVEIVGNGRLGELSNARTLDWNGNEYLAGTSTATCFIKTNGTSSQFLKADGSVDSNAYITNTVDNLTNYTTTSDLTTLLAGKENADATILKQANVVDNTSSTSTIAPLSANQGKVLNDRIDAISARGRFLSLWNSATGLPLTNPSGTPYTYHTGDFFIVSNVASGSGTNYKPNGSTYTGVASTTVESGDVKVNDTYYYDGNGNWNLLAGQSGGGTVTDVQVNSVSVLSGGVANITTLMNKDNPIGTGSIAVGDGVVASGTNSQAFGSSGIGSMRITAISGANLTYSGNIASQGQVLRHLENGNYAYYKVNSVDTTNHIITLASTPVVSDTNNWVMFYGVSTGINSHSEGYRTIASDNYSHAEGNQTISSGQSSHAEGALSKAYSSFAHAEGYSTTASGSASHAEGYGSKASGHDSHAEGYSTTASGSASHAEGTDTVVSGSRSHVEGQGTIANHGSQHVFGEYNIADTSTAESYARGNYVEIVGNGNIYSKTTFSSASELIGYYYKDSNKNYVLIDSNNCSTVYNDENIWSIYDLANARTLDWNGNEYLAGKLTAAGGLDYKNTSGTSLGGLKFIKCTQAEYDAITTKDSNTFYIIVG